MRRLPLLSALFLAATVLAQDSGSLPYATVDENIRRVVGEDAGKVAVRLFVACRKAGVKPSEITLKIDSKTAPKTLQVGADSAIYDFPITEELRKENPPVVSNQPKGMIDLSVEIGLIVPDTTTVSYQTLVKGLAQLNETTKKSTGIQGAPILNATKLAIHFSSPDATVTAPGKSGSETLKADGRGVVFLPLDAALAKEGATVTFSAKPRWIAGTK